MLMKKWSNVVVGSRSDRSHLGLFQHLEDNFLQQNYFETLLKKALNPNLMFNRITIVFSGEISLGGEKRPKKADGRIIKGNVYLDGHPICDDGWTREDATVACR